MSNTCEPAPIQEYGTFHVLEQISDRRRFVAEWFPIGRVGYWLAAGVSMCIFPTDAFRNGWRYVRQLDLTDVPPS